MSFRGCGRCYQTVTCSAGITLSKHRNLVGDKSSKNTHHRALSGEVPNLTSIFYTSEYNIHAVSNHFCILLKLQD